MVTSPSDSALSTVRGTLSSTVDCTHSCLFLLHLLSSLEAAARNAHYIMAGSPFPMEELQFEMPVSTWSESASGLALIVRNVPESVAPLATTAWAVNTPYRSLERAWLTGSP